MATLYCDFENGDDNHGGTSFALLASGIDGQISGTTFISATASFPNDGSLINQYLSIFNGSSYVVYQITSRLTSNSLTIAQITGGAAIVNQLVDRQFYIGGRWKTITSGAASSRLIAGDTVRIMGSPAPTSLGQNGQWTSEILQVTKTASGASNTTPISITSTNHGYSTGDTVVVSGVTGNTNANGTWEITNTGANTFTLNGSSGNGTSSAGTVRLRNNTRVMLTTPVTENIACTGPGRSVWTASPEVLTSFNSATKEHSASDSISIQSTFTTGLAAYWTLPSALNLSGYQQVSFWIQQVSGTIGAANAIELRLCSDSAGLTVVNTIGIPGLAATGRWVPVTVDLGVALGSNIQSIALYVNTNNGAQLFYLSNIIACKASSAPDSLTLTSLIGKNTAGETFWGIQSINGTRVMLDSSSGTGAPTNTSLRGYYGTSETAVVYKRETIKKGPFALSSSIAEFIQESGTETSQITYSGGWDRSTMSTQSLETWIDGLNGNGYGFSISSKSWVIVEKMAFARFHLSIDLTSATNCTLNVIASNNFGSTSTTGSIRLTSNSHFNTVNMGSCVASTGTGVTFAGHDNQLNISGIIASHSDQAVYLDSTSQTSRIKGSSPMALIANNVAGFDMNGAIVFVKDIAFVGNTYDIDLINSDGHRAFFDNVILGSTVEINHATNNNYFVQSQNHDQTANNHLISGGGARITSATDQRHTESGISWKIQVTSGSRISSWPVVLSLAKVAVSSNSLVTVKAWMRRTNVGLTMRLVCKGGQIDGVANDVVSSMTAAADTWEELTITFTPTEIGVVEITAEAWGGTTYSGWVDDMSISQAV